MSISNIPTNLALPAQGQPKAQPAKARTVEDHIADVRVTGQGSIEQGTALKAQAAQVIAAAKGELDTANAKIKAGADEAQQGQAKVDAGTQTEAVGVKSLNDDLAADQAAANKGAASIKSIQDGIGAAHILNAEVQIGAETLGYCLQGETKVTGDLQDKVGGLTQPTADANAITNKMNLGNVGLIAGLAGEKIAGGFVSANLADFNSALEAHDKASDTVREGKAAQSTGFNLTEQGQTDKAGAEARQGWGKTYDDDAKTSIKEALSSAGQAAKQEGISALYGYNARGLQGQSNDELAVASLLAEVASIDQEAGAKLQAIPSFLADGTATLQQADAKSQDSFNHEAQGIGFATLSKRNQELADEAGGRASDLLHQAKAKIDTAKGLEDKANGVRQEASQLDAQGDASIAQGGQLDQDGKAKQATGEAGQADAQASRDKAEKGLEKSFKYEGIAVDAQTKVLGSLTESSSDLLANIADREPNVNQVGSDASHLVTAHKIETGVVAGVQDISSQLKANVDGRIQNANDLTQSAADSDQALNGQSAALDQVASGVADAGAGAATVRHGKWEGLAGQAQAELAQNKLNQGNEQDRGADIQIEKGQKYVAAADAAEAQLKKKS